MTADTLVGDGAEGLAGLAGLVRDCAASGVARRALLLRTELLPKQLSRPHHRRLARAALDPLTLADRARLHDLPDGRLAVSWRGEAPALLDQALLALRRLLQGAPRDAPPLPDLVRLFDLPGDGPALLRMAGHGRGISPDQAPAPSSDKIGQFRRTPIEASIEHLPHATPHVVPDAGAPPLDTPLLSRIEQMLATADMSRFARRKPICHRGSAGTALAWEKRYLSVHEIAQTLAPDRSVTADAWLFRRLTRVMDRRMLALLSSAGELDRAGPFALDLNIASVLSPEFLRFDAALPQGLRGKVVLDVSPADLMADPAAFAFARDFARARDYKLLLRGVTAPLLPVLQLDRLDLDYIELWWGPGMAQLDLTPQKRAIWLLAHVDDAAGLDWGEAQGITLFQGRVIRSA